MDSFVVLLLCIVAILIEVWIAGLFYAVAQMKGFNSSVYLWTSILFGPAGWLLVCALPDRGNTPQAISDELPDL